MAVEYLNEDGKVVAMSEFPVELTAGQETVADDFETQEASRLVVKGSADYVLVGEDITLTASVVYGDEFSEDFIEREVSNDDMTYALYQDRNYGEFEPKQGENGTFTAGSAGYSYILASYTDNVQVMYAVSALEQEEKIAGYLFTDEFWFRGWEPGDADFVPMLYTANPAPGFTKSSHIVPRFRGVLGTNEAIAILWGHTANDHFIPLTAEWSGEGDYLQVTGSGRAGLVRLSGAGTDGTITATVGAGDNKQEISMPLMAMEASSHLVPLELDDASSLFSLFNHLEEYPAPGDTVQAYPGVEYMAIIEDRYYYDCYYIGKNDSAITWSMDGSADTITIDETGLITVSANAQVGDEGEILFTVNGYEPDGQAPGIIVVAATQQ